MQRHSFQNTAFSGRQTARTHIQHIAIQTHATISDPAQFKSRIERSFNARARSYDMLDEFHPTIALKLVSLLNPQPGEKAIDVASGTGHVSLETASRVGPSGRVVANDIAAAMLQQQEMKIDFYGVQGIIEMAPGDADTLQYDSEFDIVSCATALPFFPDVDSTLKRWHSWLKPGGRCGFNAFRSPQNPDNGLWCDLIQSEYGQSVQEANARLGTKEMCVEAMVKAGFKDVEATEVQGVYPMYGPTLEEYADKVWRMSISSPFWPAESQKALTPEQLEEFRMKFMARCQEEAVKSGRYDGSKMVNNPFTVIYITGRK